MKGIGVGKFGIQIIPLKGISLLFLISFIVGTWLLSSCTKTNEFTIGEDFVQGDARLQIVDTFRVNLSTILLDSLTTSSTEVALVGSYSDEIFGSVSCESYFSLKYQPFDDLDEKAIFDSASFVLRHSGYYYGDTTSLMTIEVHQLLEEIETFDNGYLYNNSSFSYDPEIVGTVTFYPEPNTGDSTISIPASSLGELLFTMIENKDEAVTSEEWFKDYFKGFVLTPGPENNSAVMGYIADANNLFFKIYYHIDSEYPSDESKEISIAMNESGHPFNNISYDFTGSPFEVLSQEKNSISSSLTGNHSFMQGGTGLLTKIQFPSLQEVLYGERWKILKAELIFEPVKNSYDNFPLPDKLYIYDTDKENRVNSVLKNSDGNALIASFEFDEVFGENTRYTFDITNFILSELSDSFFDYEHGLLIGLEQEKFRETLDRLIIEGKTPPVKLRLYYLTY